MKLIDFGKSQAFVIDGNLDITDAWVKVPPGAIEKVFFEWNGVSTGAREGRFGIELKGGVDIFIGAQARDARALADDLGFGGKLAKKPTAGRCLV